MGEEKGKLLKWWDSKVMVSKHLLSVQAKLSCLLDVHSAFVDPEEQKYHSFPSARSPLSQTSSIYFSFHRKSPRLSFNELVPQDGWCSLDPFSKGIWSWGFFWLKLSLSCKRTNSSCRLFLYRDIHYIYIEVQLLLPSISKMFSFSPAETSYSQSNSSPFPPPLPVPGNHHSTFCPTEFN